MPSLALDVGATYPPERKRAFAARLAAVYASVMGTDLQTISVVVHDGGDGAVWRFDGAGAAVAGAVLMCDIRRGRPVAVREDLCRRMVAVCEELLGIDPTALKIEFTQHDGDEMFHPHLGGFNRDWDDSERGA